MKHTPLKIIIIFFLFLYSTQGLAWHDKTHLAVAKAAGMASWYNAAGPDLAKIKAGNIESYNHFFNNDAEREITAQMVMDQIERYNLRSKLLDGEGHILGAIIASLRAYQKDVREGKYAEYHLSYCAHYIGDLSQPLHNMPYDDFNQKFHLAFDGVVEGTILDETEKITSQMYAVKLSDDRFEEDLAKEIARMANVSRKLGYKLRAENRIITKEEAYIQLGHSASLLKAVLDHYR